MRSPKFLKEVNDAFLAATQELNAAFAPVLAERHDLEIREYRVLALIADGVPAPGEIGSILDLPSYAVHLAH